MAEITTGAAFSWREHCAQLGCTLSLSTTAFVRSGHSVNVTGASAVIDASGLYPLTNLTNRQLMKVARIVCTPAQDTTGGGNSRWYYPTIQLNCSMTSLPGTATSPFANTFGLLAMNCVYPSLEPSIGFAQGGFGGYYTAVGIDTWSGTAFSGTNFYHKVVGDGSLFDSPRAPMTYNGYTFPNHTVRYADRQAVGSVRFTIMPGTLNYAGEASNPGTCYISIGRIWVADSLIIPLGIDGGWKWKNSDPSIINVSRGQQTYADEFQRLRSIDWTATALTDQQAYDPAFIQLGNVPSFTAAQLEAGCKGEFLFQGRLSGVSGVAGGYFADSGQLYGRISSPGIEVDDETSGNAQAMGNVIESR
jgi:hypothetical protein